MTQRMLLIDDDAAIREVYQEVLKNGGYEVETAEDGKTGLEKIIEGGYDFVLMDVMMPQLDGIGVLEELKEQKPKNKNGPIILFTNIANDPAIKEGLANGAKACLNKSEMNPDEFLKKIKELVG